MISETAGVPTSPRGVVGGLPRARRSAVRNAP
jgi:hypothetical protein